MNWSPVVWSVIGVAYVLGFVAGLYQNLITLVVALVLSLVGLLIQFTDVAEDVKSTLLGFPAIIVPVITLALTGFGYLLSSDE